jgi:hypothetical protein
MKKIKYLIIICCLFTACKKDTLYSSGIIGQWRWVESMGGLSNVHQTPANTGYLWGIKLNANLTCFQTGNVFPTETGTYSLSEQTEYDKTRKYLNIKTFHSTQQYNYIFISKDTLLLQDHAGTDGLSHFFVRE